MNLDRLKKSVGGRVHLRPTAISLDELGRSLPARDDDWIIDAVTDEDVRISNVVTNHFTHLGRDHIHHYTTNPDESRRAGLSYGFFTLNVQIYLNGRTLTVTPSPRPGEPVPPPKPLVAEVVVDLSYPADSGLLARLASRGYQVAWVRESRVARCVNLEGWSVVVDRSAPGRRVTYRLKDKPEDQILIMKAASAA